MGRSRDVEGLTDEETLDKIWRSFYIACSPGSFVFLWPIFRYKVYFLDLPLGGRR